MPWPMKEGHQGLAEEQAVGLELVPEQVMDVYMDDYDPVGWV